MSTRADIIILDKDIKYTGDWHYVNKIQDYAHSIIYVHNDGYPEGLGEVIQEYLKSDGARARISDIEYLSANIIPWLKDSTRKDMKKEIDYTGYGICKHIHGDIQYHYIIDLHRGSLICIDTYEGFVYEKTFEKLWS